MHLRTRIEQGKITLKGIEPPYRTKIFELRLQEVDRRLCDRDLNITTQVELMKEKRTIKSLLSRV